MNPSGSAPIHDLLLIEDSPDDEELVGFALRNAPFKFKLRRVETREELLAALDASRPDVVLCDFHLPRFSMQEALRIVREEQGLDTPFIVVSRLIGEDAAVQAMRDGADDYVLKNRLGRLPSAIESTLDRKRLRQESETAEAARRHGDMINRSVLKSVSMRIAVLDGEGRILAMNPAWQRHQASEAGAPGIGDDYFALLRAGGNLPEAVAASLCEGVQAVIARREERFASEYALEGRRGAARWEMLRAEPLEDSARGAVVSIEDITSRMLSQVALREANRRLQKLSRRILTVQEDERRAIALELHDDIGQSLAALKITLHALASRVPETEAARMGHCVAIAEETLDKLRRLSYSLRPPQLEQFGLEGALRWLAEQHSQATGLAVDCQVAPLQRRPEATVEVACYRIVQEALNNATRHAKADGVVVDVKVHDRLLHVAVRDNGRGFDTAEAQDRAARTGSLGLLGMAERAELAGGSLKVKSVHGGGTTVSAVFPMEGARQQP